MLSALCWVTVPSADRMRALLGSRVVFAGAAALACMLVSTNASSESSFQTYPALDLPLTIGTWSIVAAVGLAHYEMEGDLSCAEKACSTGGGRDGARRHDPFWETVSDVPLALSISLSLSPSIARYAEDQDVESGLADSTTLLTEAVGFTVLATELAKISTVRRRPFLRYPPEPGTPSRTSADSVASFWSGHASVSFASAAVGTFDACRAPGPLGCVGPAVGLHALALSTAAMRVLAGRHHVSDVMAGAAVGSAIGSGVSLAHPPPGGPMGREAGQAVLASQGLTMSLLFLW